MKSKLFEDWVAGVDRRRDRSMTEPDRLWNLKNAYIDNGGRLRTRTGVYKLGTFTNCDGLMMFNGVLYTFAITGASPTPAATFAGIITLPAGPGGQTTIKRVWFAQPFGTTHYVVVEFSDGVISHYYNAVRVTSASCPNTNRVTIAANRVWCADNAGNVAFSGLGDGADWAGATAGTLPTRNQAANMGANVTALNTYQSDLVVFFENGAQVWFPDTDKTKIFIRQRLYNVGVNPVPGPLVAAPFGEDLAFLSQDGIRSLSLSTNTANRIEQDIGAPIRSMQLGVQSYSVAPGPYFHYKQFPKGTSNSLAMDLPETVFVSGISQLWFMWPHVSDEQEAWSDLVSYADDKGAGRTAILVMSYGQKRMSWSLYNVPIRAKSIINGIDINLAYALQNTNTTPPYNPTLWTFRENYVDYDASYNEVGIQVGIDLPFLDMDKPGGMKHFKAMDMVTWPVAAQPTVKYLYDPNDETKETIAQVITGGDSRGRGLSAVEVSAPSIAPVIRYTTSSADGSQFRLSGIQLYYEDDGGPV